MAQTVPQTGGSVSTPAASFSASQPPPSHGEGHQDPNAVTAREGQVTAHRKIRHVVYSGGPSAVAVGKLGRRGDRQRDPVSDREASVFEGELRGLAGAGRIGRWRSWGSSASGDSPRPRRRMWREAGKYQRRLRLPRPPILQQSTGTLRPPSDPRWDGERATVLDDVTVTRTDIPRGPGAFPSLNLCAS